jgi:hypothetical protein
LVGFSSRAIPTAPHPKPVINQQTTGTTALIRVVHDWFFDSFPHARFISTSIRFNPG